MDFPCKRFIAHLLLFGQLLSSCAHPVRLRIGHAPRHISNRQSNRATPFIPTTVQTYLAKGGHQVTFWKKEGSWEAQVIENSVSGFRRVLDHLPVHCAPTYSINLPIGLCVVVKI